jgi:hydrogenase nickel incorporation protein HypA/HybF
VAAELLRLTEQAVRSAGAARATAICLRVGEFSGVESWSLQSAIQTLMPGTVARGARLEIEDVPLLARCTPCGCQFPVKSFRFQCPACGAVRTQIISGEELELVSVCVENEQSVV